MSSPAVSALRAALKHTGLTNRKNAKKLKVNPERLSKLLSERDRPGLDLSFHIEDVLGVPARLWAKKWKGARR